MTSHIPSAALGAIIGGSAVAVYVNYGDSIREYIQGMLTQPVDEIPEDCPGPESAGAGYGSACQGCPSQGACQSGEARDAASAADLLAAQIADKLKDVKKKVLILSGKGGVGKSTVSTQLAFALAGTNSKMREAGDVGLLDIDICGPSIPRMLGLSGREVRQSAEGWQPVYVDDRLAVMSIGFLLPNQDDAIIWRGPRKHGLIRQFLTDVTWGSLDFLLIDTPPGTSDEHLSIVNYLSQSNVDGAVIVTTPQEVSLQDVRKEINFCRKVGIPILGVVENMAGFMCPTCSTVTDIFKPSTGGASAMCKAMGVEYLGSLPLDPSVMAAGDEGCPLKASRATESLGDIVAKIRNAL